MGWNLSQEPATGHPAGRPTTFRQRSRLPPAERCPHREQESYHETDDRQSDHTERVEWSDSVLLEQHGSEKTEEET